MRLRYLLKLISGFTVGAIAIVTLLIYVCPGIFMPNAASRSVDTTALCQGGAMLPVAGGDVGGGCLGNHLEAAQRFIVSLAGEINLLLVVFFALIIIYFGSQTEFLIQLRAAWTRYKHRYRLYFVSIRRQCQKKIIAWLSLFDNYEIVSLA